MGGTARPGKSAVLVVEMYAVDQNPTAGGTPFIGLQFTGTTAEPHKLIVSCFSCYAAMPVAFLYRVRPNVRAVM